MQLTEAWREYMPETLQLRYRMRETRNASAILRSSNAELYGDVIHVLSEFTLEARDLLLPGGSEGSVAKKLNGAFRELGWREARVDTVTQTTLVVFPYAPHNESEKRLVSSDPVSFEGYKADWVKGRVAGDCEWNAKDGNLDRDLASYRSLYETGYIDAAVLVTRTQADLRELEAELTSVLMATPDDEAAEALRTTDAVITATKQRIATGTAKGM
ncbi:BglII/BstYI family type II restriction endonuclease [Galbitalea sp. SE-J8]|uniref:BglII/BstYI family type II restriction endonuclease n=1 Tax=Galbitalea sp. SE-J8 TaxID=3054952 RepID=UPI00259D04D9|nr:BglII/BstYI family type II restriction endonuclease [Galbitalea sp. SE-J8]MDM4762690.1 BglII/BstYI family type II restriction endonuclease [Galbitalea sp. SE-J8]